MGVEAAGVWAGFVRGGTGRGGLSEKGAFSSQVSRTGSCKHLPASETKEDLRRAPGKIRRGGQAFSWFSGQTTMAQCIPRPGCRFAAGPKNQGGQPLFMTTMTQPRRLGLLCPS